MCPYTFKANWGHIRGILKTSEQLINILLKCMGCADICHREMLKWRRNLITVGASPTVQFGIAMVVWKGWAVSPGNGWDEEARWKSKQMHCLLADVCSPAFEIYSCRGLCSKRPWYTFQFQHPNQTQANVIAPSQDRPHPTYHLTPPNPHPPTHPPKQNQHPQLSGPQVCARL